MATATNWFDAEREEFTRIFQNEFETIQNVAVKYQNKKFDQPKEVIWVAFHIMGGDGFQASLGTQPIERYIGMLQMDIMIPENSGMITANTLASAFGKVFSRRHIQVTDGVTSVFKPPLRPTFIEAMDGFARSIVRIPFRTDLQTAKV